MTPTNTMTALCDALLGGRREYKFKESKQGNTALLEIDVEPPYYGRLVGSGGRIVQALQVIAALAGNKYGQQQAFQITKKEYRETGPQLPFVPSMNWNSDWLADLAQDTAEAMFFDEDTAVEVEDHQTGRTSLRFVLSSEEPQHLADGLVRKSLQNVFVAIGNASGRKLDVTMERV